MHILVTAGNTQTPIDQVRCITNIFSGRTGARIAEEAFGRGHAVTIFTSHPEVLEGENYSPKAAVAFNVEPYRTFDDLFRLMSEAVPSGQFDAIVHAAAVSDYALAGSYGLASGTRFDPNEQTWTGQTGSAKLEELRAGKLKSNYPELWLRLTPTPKLADMIRDPWGFRGTFVKFKLEVELAEAELLAVAERARVQSRADWMVANTLEGMREFAYIGPFGDGYRKVARADLASSLIDAIESRV